MRTVIIGCGRTGAVLAATFESLGHEVTVLDTSTRAFDRLPPNFRGSTVRGDGTDEDVLRRAGVTDADLLLAMTEGDNRNIMAGQLATEVLGVRQVIVKINDPVRADAYTALGMATICRTNLMEDAILTFIGQPARHLAGVRAPTGTHPGGEHHDTGAAAPATEA
jgi:trk system potassium uptake protein TrkA